MKKAIFIITLFVLAISGCKTQKHIPMSLPSVVLNNSDSVKIETIVETDYVPIEVSVDLPQQADSNNTPNDSSHVETDLAMSDAWIVDGVLHHNIKNKSGQLKGQSFVPQKTAKINKEVIEVKEIPVPEPYPVEVERKFSLMEQIKLAVFWYLIGAVIVSIGIIFRKPLLMALRKIIRL